MATAVVGCASSDDATESPHPTLAPEWKEWFDQARSGASEWVESVLEDYWVTEAEWQEAKDRFHECTSQYGLEGFISATGAGVSTGITPADEAKALAGVDSDDPEARNQAVEKAYDLVIACSDDDIGDIGSAYLAPRFNPDAIDHMEAVRRCFESIGRPELRGATDEEIDESTDPVFSEPEVRQCIIAPSY